MQREARRWISFAGTGGLRLMVLAVTILMSSLWLWAQTGQPASYPAVPYPSGYRDWTHVKSNLIGPTHSLYKEIGGYQHIYANQQGMEGYRTGRFPEGSILIYDFLEGREHPSGSTAEGPRRFTSVMVKDTKLYAATGGWGYEEFRGDSETDRMIAAAASTKCFACHTKQKESDYVFSKYRK
ncbi:MAG TPA: cytochrome P460 family protein [Blastocatellia bacterium]|nr:cytochrome P460 family protein [Blastocatellia bacterium]